MGVPDEVKRMATEVVGGLIDSMRPEIIALVTIELIDRVRNVDMPPLDHLQGGDDDDPTDMFECPHCLQELEHNEVIMVDIDVRSVEVYEVDGETLQFDTDSASNYEDFHLKCGNCGLFVGKPSGWDIDWV